MSLYRTFIRSCRNWQEFAKARKITVGRALTYEEAKRQCQTYNTALTPRQKARGTKMEFTAE